MQNVIAKLALAAIIPSCLFMWGKASAHAGELTEIPALRTISAQVVIAATGESTIRLPAAMVAKGVDGVVIERNGKGVPISYFVRNNDLHIVPSTDLEGGLTYDLKVFVKTGGRSLVKAQVEAFPKFDISREQTIRVPAKPSKGFSYPYVLHIPRTGVRRQGTRLLVNCVNTDPGTSQRVFDEGAIAQAAGNTVTELARRLQVPCMVPAFPRYSPDQTNDYSYPQILDAAAVRREKTDSQLAAMINDARQTLERNGIAVSGKVFMYGFSTDGKFAQRFTLLHPDIVMATVAGGIAGFAALPVANYQHEVLNYPLGTADIKSLTGKAFDKSEYAKVPQYFLMGEEDKNDATEWRDCYSQKDADQIWRLFGRKQIPDRWNATQILLADVAPCIQCRTYPSVGHDITPEMRDDIEKFYRDHWNR